MKKIIASISVAFCISQTSHAQKIGIGTNSPVNSLEVVSTVSSPGIAAISGTNEGTTGSAIIGNSAATNTLAVIGQSNNGIGVQGYTNNNIGILALAGSGIALNTSSFTSYALIVSGNLRLAGGNTHPADGAVLTSDAIGNATWKKNNIAFLGNQSFTSAVFTDGVFKKVEFLGTDYNLQSGFLPYSGAVTSTSSTFLAPIAGVYHFTSSGSFFKSGFGISNFYFDNAQIKLVKNGVTVATFIGQPLETIYSASEVDLQVVCDIHLSANDRVWIEAAQFGGAVAEVYNDGRFSGHLVTAD